jgi:hypothetical protein
MPTPTIDEPIQKVTLNLFTSDIDWLKRHHGQGWTTYIRELVRVKIKEQQRAKRD